MKLHAERDDSIQLITALGPGWIAVNKVEHRQSLIIGADGLLERWGDVSDYESLTPAHFEILKNHAPEFVIFGSGTQLRFPPPPWIAPLVRAGIAVETMDTAAACRTYNVLALEGRKMLAALIVA